MNKGFIPVGLLGALALSSCGGNVALSSLTSSLASSPSGPGTTTPAPAIPSVPLASATPTTSRTAAPAPSSATPPAAIPLSRVGVRAGDLPSGWSAQPADRAQADSDAGEQAELRACAGLSDDSGSRTEVAESSDYSSDPFDVWSIAARYRTAGAAHVESLTSAKAFPGCFGSLIKRGWIADAPLGTVFGKVTVTVVRRSAGLPANLVAAVTTVIPVNDHGDRFSLYDTAFYLSGRTVQAQVRFSGQARLFPVAVMRRVAALVAARVATA